ncbi:MAG TPA: hypothetical protein HPP87_08270 [Planctomycetes bacterium]|nr:hypothetical protein [Planctomycetota bacterium]HIJ71343.1 hypothetical protein [Planctomycetota bacterium]
MSISFHCESCKKRIKAPDESGGKWGNCPYCNHRCYIPRPPAADDEELKLAPIDESDETRYGRLMQETRSLTQDILQEKKLQDEPSADSNMSKDEVLKQIIVYLRYVADGDLGLASGSMNKITANRETAREVLKNMAAAEEPEPELMDIPPKVLNGLINNLYLKLK